MPPRSADTEARYRDFKHDKQRRGGDMHVFDINEEIVLREFTHWLIIENRFPYDNMVCVNHLLIPRRPFADFTEATTTELAEHEAIRMQLVQEQFYDAIVENLPRSKSVKNHVHLHLICWKESNITPSPSDQ